MASPRGDKPYRVYRGGRVKGKVPTLPKPARPAEQDGRGTFRYRGPGAKPRRPQWSWRRWTALALGVLVLLFLIWSLASYLSFRSGVKDANKRLPESAKAVLVSNGGLMLSHSSDILLLGTDHAALASRASDRHSDSVMLVRTDPKHHRIVYLSIPRDLRVPNIPGHGPDKINAAFQIGGPRLAAMTVHEYTGLPINHLVVVDFGNFRKLIDELGGVDVNVPAPILSNRFDCPYSTQERCARWRGWRFAKGRQHMNGQRALIFSRIRENRLDPRETDITRGERQQLVMQAIADKLTSLGTLLKLPFVGGDVMKPLATDLSPTQFLELGWVKFRAGRTLHCRLGGDAAGGYIEPSEDNRNVILMVLGKSAPQPPPPSNETFPPGCLIGKQFTGG
jgi:LCP family protein required for cell wall assembly